MKLHIMDHPLIWHTLAHERYPMVLFCMKSVH